MITLRTLADYKLISRAQASTSSVAWVEQMLASSSTSEVPRRFSYLGGTIPIPPHSSSSPSPSPSSPSRLPWASSASVEGAWA